jgi:hypothetical protein
MFLLLYLQDRTLKRVAFRGFSHELRLKISSCFLFVSFYCFFLKDSLVFHVLAFSASWFGRKYDVGYVGSWFLKHFGIF